MAGPRTLALLLEESSSEVLLTAVASSTFYSGCQGAFGQVHDMSTGPHQAWCWLFRSAKLVATNYSARQAHSKLCSVLKPASSKHHDNQYAGACQLPCHRHFAEVFNLSLASLSLSTLKFQCEVHLCIFE